MQSKYVMTEENRGYYYNIVHLNEGDSESYPLC